MTQYNDIGSLNKVKSKSLIHFTPAMSKGIFLAIHHIHHIVRIELFYICSCKFIKIYNKHILGQLLSVSFKFLIRKV